MKEHIRGKERAKEIKREECVCQREECVSERRECVREECAKLVFCLEYLGYQILNFHFHR